MFDFNTTTKIRRGQQHLFLGNMEVSGVQSFEMNFSVPEEPIVHIGMSNVLYAAQGIKGGSARTQAFILGRDHFINLTGETGINGYLVKTTKNVDDNFSFESGYLTQYSQRCSIGELPQVGAQIEVFGRVGKLEMTNSDQIDSELGDIRDGTFPTYDLANVNAGSIDIDFGDEFEQDRISSYQVDIAVQRRPHYRLGSDVPHRVTTIYPIAVTLALSMELSHFQPRNNFDSPCSPDSGDFNLKLKNFHNDNVVVEYNFADMRLQSQSYSVNAAGAPVLDLQYIGLVLKPEA